jgi:UPF0755 protein
MEKAYEQFKLFLSRTYVRFLSLTRATHSELLPQTKPKLVAKQNRKSLAILIFVLLVSSIVYFEYIRPPADFPVDTLVTLEENKPLITLADSLEEQGVVRSAAILNILTRIRGDALNVHAGDYLFKEPVSVFNIARRIATGAFGIEAVHITIPEGINVYQIADIFEDRLLRFDRELFLEYAEPLEGYLFPDTYFLMPNTKEAELVRIMKHNFDTKIATLESGIQASGRSLEEIVTMASIIEREAKKPNDQKMISGVLWHRIAINMPLQVDATFVYTHNKGSSQITMDELRDKENLYNTYAHKGLPPGPIAAPGLNALTAAVYPTENTYLFYLADSAGTTYFSKTYEEHLAKRQKYINF